MHLSRLCNPSKRGEGPTPASPSPTTDENAPSLSFICICEASKEGAATYLSESVSDIIGFEPQEAIGRPASDFAHPDDAGQLYRVYQEMISEDKAACLLYVRVRHKDPRKGYVLCSVSCSSVGAHLVGGVSAATSGVKAMVNASTAQEVFVIAPSAAQFEYSRWNDRTPTSSVQASPVGQEELLSSADPADSSSTSFPLPLGLTPESDTSPTPLLCLSSLSARSLRTALILERFSSNCTILHITNEDIFPTLLVMGRPFYDFIVPTDENRVRCALDAVKSWGVNERGHPSDGGFAFNRFTVLRTGRDSSPRHEVAPVRSRNAQQSTTPLAHPSGDAHAEHGASSASPSDSATTTSSRSRIQSHAPDQNTELLVDAIFSPQSDGIIVILRPAHVP